jgi:hypothetical protein
MNNNDQKHGDNTTNKIFRDYVDEYYSLKSSYYGKGNIISNKKMRRCIG